MTNQFCSTNQVTCCCSIRRLYSLVMICAECKLFEFSRKYIIIFFLKLFLRSWYLLITFQTLFVVLEFNFPFNNTYFYILCCLADTSIISEIALHLKVSGLQILSLFLHLTHLSSAQSFFPFFLWVIVF